MEKTLKFVEKKLCNLWKQDKTIKILYQDKILNIRCYLDNNQEQYFYFEEFNHSFNIRLFRIQKWFVLTREYSKKEKPLTIEDLINKGKLHLIEAIKISTIIKQLYPEETELLKIKK